MNDGKKAAKFFSAIFYAIYLLLFPPFFLGALIWYFATEPRHLPDFIITLVWFLLPFSLLLSIYSMWSNYRKDRYKAALLCCAIPFVAFAVFVAVNMVIDALGLRTAL